MKFVLLVLLAPLLAHAQQSPLPMSILVQALRTGEVSITLPDNAQLRPAIAEVQRRAGSNEPVQLRVVRLARFAQQPECGRIGFFIHKASAAAGSPVSGAQLNICETGVPPKRVCPDRPGELVPAQLKCRDGSAPVDTAEVAAAIKQAVLAGGISAPAARRQTGSQPVAKTIEAGAAK